MKKFLYLLPSWLIIASLISSLNGQSVIELEFEEFSTLNVLESVTIRPDMISSSGKLLVPVSGNEQLYQMKVRFQDAPSIVNSAPTISDIPDQISQEIGTDALAFTIDDTQTAADSLIISGSSSNTTLVPNANIVFGGSGASRTVTVRPNNSIRGTAVIAITVSDGSLSTADTFYLDVCAPVPASFALIPKGTFTMGDSLDLMSDAPLRTVMLDAFYIGRHEVTKAEWDEVTTWGSSRGYNISGGSAKASNHPVTDVTWYDVVKWCNARSQKEGLTPVYYTNNEQTTIYRTGYVNVTNAQVKWSANGYRLPTEAEWEKAARGGLAGKRFPWGDTISHSQANYYSYDGCSYDLSGAANNYHPTYATGPQPYTSPVGSFAANGYGLYDMAGNVFEWCWDLSGAYAEGIQTNPRGVATSDTRRIFRGGYWGELADLSRVAQRSAIYPEIFYLNIGFRIVRRPAF